MWCSTFCVGNVLALEIKLPCFRFSIFLVYKLQPLLLFFSTWSYLFGCGLTVLQYTNIEYLQCSMEGKFSTGLLMDLDSILRLDTQGSLDLLQIQFDFWSDTGTAWLGSLSLAYPWIRLMNLFSRGLRLFQPRRYLSHGIYSTSKFHFSDLHDIY